MVVDDKEAMNVGSMDTIGLAGVLSLLLSLCFCRACTVAVLCEGGVCGQSRRGDSSVK